MKHGGALHRLRDRSGPFDDRLRQGVGPGAGRDGGDRPEASVGKSLPNQLERAGIGGDRVPLRERREGEAEVRHRDEPVVREQALLHVDRSRADDDGAVGERFPADDRQGAGDACIHDPARPRPGTECDRGRDRRVDATDAGHDDGNPPTAEGGGLPFDRGHHDHPGAGSRGQGVASSVRRRSTSPASGAASCVPDRRSFSWTSPSASSAPRITACEAPDFDAKTIDGHEFKLSDYRGKVVLLDFYGFW